MKIAMIGHKRVPSREGGVEIHVEEIASRLAALGHEVTVYNRRKKGFSAPKSYRGVRIVNVPTVDRKSLDAVLYSFFATLHALFGGYDVIHYHAEGPCAMLVLPHLFGIRTAATIHGLDWQRSKWGGFATKFLLHGEKTAAKYADAVIVLSENVRRYFEDTYGRRTVFIPNGVNRPQIREPGVIQEKYGLCKNGYLLFLARIVPEKGLHDLLEAFSDIRTDQRLVIAGAGSHTDGYVQKIRAMAERDGRVIMTGFVQGRELEELYSNAYLYVLPSSIEGMPISLLEAMSYGCRCLVSDIPENSTVVGDCGYTFKTGDRADLRKKLEAILREEPDARLGARAQKRVLETYSWDRAADALLARYSHS